MKKILIIVTIALLSLAASGQPFKGTWTGKLSVQDIELTMVLHIGDACTLDVPSQGAKDIPVEINGTGSAQVKLSIPMIGASYEGLYLGNTIVGTFRQTGMEFPLAFKRGKPAANRPQTPKPPFPYNTEEFTFTNSDAVLSGTLTTPHGMSEETPIVLMVSGSGLQNRDEELFEHKPFAVIADVLAKNGIASLRYDDRSYGKSTGDASNATTKTFMEDAHAGVTHLRSLGFKHIGILGHSEGGTIAFMLAADGLTDFIVSMAGMAETGEKTLLDQTTRIAVLTGMSGQDAKAYAENAISHTKATGNAYMQYLMTLDPAPYISEVKCPVLAINGEKDSQVLCETHLAVIRTLVPHADTKAYPELNHMFQHCTTGHPTEYYNIEETISPEVPEDIAEWINRLHAGKNQ